MIKSFKFFPLITAVFFSLPFLHWTCSTPEVREVPDVAITEVSLTLSDTANLEIGALIRWNIESEDSLKYTSFNLYSKYEVDGEAFLVRKELDANLRSFKTRLPDTSAEKIFFGIEGEYLSETDQLWKSDSIPFEKITLISNVIINGPVEDSHDSSILSVFELQTIEDLGVCLRFFAFSKEYGEGESSSMYLPFSSKATETNCQVYYGRTPVTDSLQFAFGEPGELVPINWCVLSTATPGINPLNLKQSLICSKFFRIR